MRYWLAVALMLPATVPAWDNLDWLKPQQKYVAKFTSPGCISSGTVLSPGPTTLTVTRASTQYVDIGGTLTSCPANSLAVSAQGAEVWAQGVNAALQSSTSCVANAVQTPWALTGIPTCVSDADVAPDGTTTMDAWNGVDTTAGPKQTVTTASSTVFVGSAWMTSTNGNASFHLSATGGASGCMCGTSDGSACTPSVFSTTYCQALFTGLGSTPVRTWVSGTFATAGTTATFYQHSGLYGTNAAVSNLWGAQVEVGSYPTPYIPTTTGTGTRNATVASVPLPALHTTNNWCVGITVIPAAWVWSVVPSHWFWSLGTGTTANTATLGYNSTTIYFQIYNATATLKQVTLSTGAWAGAKRVVVQSTAGAMALYVDGAATSPAPAGIGDGLLGATPAALYLGQRNSGEFLDGSLSNIKIRVNPASWRDCN